jgi:hypothetical protein
MVKLSEQLNEALSQFKIAANGTAAAAVAAATESANRPQLVAAGGPRSAGNGGAPKF